MKLLLVGLLTIIIMTDGWKFRPKFAPSGPIQQHTGGWSSL